MANRIDLLSQQLLQKDISNCSVEEIKVISQQYPFFAPAQFILLRKLKDVYDPAYHQQVQRAVLYHHSPSAFEFLMNEEEYQSSFPEEIVPVSEELPAAIDTVVTEENVDSNMDPSERKKIEESAEEDEPVEEVSVSNLEEVPIIETSGFDLMEEVNEEKPGPEMEPSTDESTVEDQPIEEEENPSKENDGPEVILKSYLSFEPYHTIDYFASQGIKLSQEEISKDKFGRQLKSFTEWLKTMKRLPATDQIKKLDQHTVEKVENIAAHSVDNTEILTETMAEVWIKQGKIEKAIEVYNKLSLLNPSKRGYFAAKLENLKKAI
jgi:hypothetical protein